MQRVSTITCWADASSMHTSARARLRLDPSSGYRLGAMPGYSCSRPLAFAVRAGQHARHVIGKGCTVYAMSLSSWAAPNAERLLSPVGARWDHVRQVAEQARRIAGIVPPADRDLLVAAAYLHDVGYASELAKTGFHPLDGARWIRDYGPGGRLARLVAHHSCALYEARVRGLAETLLSEFEPEESPTYDALVFCDLTTGPTGEIKSFDGRINDIYERYGPDHEVSRALNMSHAVLAACHARVLALLESTTGQPMYGSSRFSR